MRTWKTGAVGSLALAVSVVAAGSAGAQDKLGVVTTAIGPVTVARTSTPPAPLKFKDDVYRYDRITTGEDAMTRILLGGKVVVTARERSTLTITEVPGLSTIDLTGGRIAVAVDKTRMKPGERVDIRTPNAIAGVRGTVLIVEASPGTSTVTVLRGLVDVVRLDPKTGRAVGAITPVGAQQTVSVRNNVLPPRAQPITPARSQALSKEFSPPMRAVDSAAVVPVTDEVKRAATLVDTLLRSTTSAGAAATTGVPTSGATSDAVSSTRASAPTSGASSVSGVTGAVSTTTSALPTTTTVLPTATAPLTTTVAPVLSSPVVAPVTSTVPKTTTLVPPIVQPVVQTVVTPVTNLVK
jgi:hypothetical protein